MSGSSSELAQAEALIQLRRWPEAAAVLGRAVAAAPDATRPRCLLAFVLLESKQFAEARKQAEAAIALDPEAEWPHRIRSLALSGLGNKKGAVAAAREAVRLAPGLSNAYIVLGGAELAAGHGTAARAAARRALELAPNGPDGHNLLGRVALARRRWSEAEGHFRAGLVFDPENPALLNNVGVALSGQGKKREAVAYFANSSRLNPASDLARRNAVRTAGVSSVGVIVAVQALSYLVGNLSWVVVALAGVVVGGTMLLKRRRGSVDPKAGREMMRSLRRQYWQSRRWLHPPVWALVVIMVVSALLAMGALDGLVHPPPGDTGAPAYVLLLVICAGGVGLSVWELLRRWPPAGG